ncbi:MAG: hypothetical protein DVB29_04870 [Verrucomicrobia bacterium]|nr:MAG: hypothetical protein DVB29_04870 [Verrucomicrobiota bacterium]
MIKGRVSIAKKLHKICRVALLFLFLSSAILFWQRNESSFFKIKSEDSLAQLFSKELGESASVALLGGLRIPLSIWLWMRVEVCWETKEWNKMEPLLERIVLLQPHEIIYYTMASWELAWNASCGVNNEEEKDYFINAGRRFLEKGIMNNPESSLLYEYLGVLLRDRLHDHEGAAASFAKASTLPEAHSYLRRFIVYELAAAGNHDLEAYEQLQMLYGEGKEERTPSLLALKKNLEEKIYKKRK